MKNMILAAALVAASALAAVAQTNLGPSTDAGTPAMTTQDTKNPAAPVAGANSFTEAQAKDASRRPASPRSKTSRKTTAASGWRQA